MNTDITSLLPKDESETLESIYFETEDHPPLALTLFSPRPESLTAAELQAVMDGGRVQSLDEPSGGDLALPPRAFRVDMPELIAGHDITLHVHRMPDQHLATALPQLRQTFLRLAGGDEANMTPRLLEWLAAAEQAWVVETDDVEIGTPGLSPIYKLATRLADKLFGFAYGYGMVLCGSGSLLRPVGHPHDGRQNEAWRPTERQMARRQRSLEILAQRQVPTYDGELYVDDDDAVIPRLAQEAARRALALLATALRAEGLPLAQARAIVRQEDDWSPSEQAFIHRAVTDPATRQGLIWRYEAVWTLLWALGWVRELEWPAEAADMPRLMELFQQLMADPDFVDRAVLRPKSELLDAQDLILRIHWALRDSYLRQVPLPIDLDWNSGGDLVPVAAHPGVAVTEQRHLAINWLMGFSAEWDDVATPT